MSKPQRHKVLTWNDVDRLMDNLIPRLEAVGPFQAMVIITRGGVVPRRNTGGSPRYSASADPPLLTSRPPKKRD